MGLGPPDDITSHAAWALAKFLEEKGYPTIAVPVTSSWRFRPYKNIKNEFTPDISHIHAAVAAGLGEIGWDGNFLSPQFGPRERLNTVITSAPLDPDPMYDGPPLCDHCLDCVKFCPTHSLSKEVKGINKVEIGGKTYRYINKNKWRCALSDHFLVDVKIPYPERIDEKVAIEMVEKHGQWTWEATCWRVCLPPFLRVKDPYYSVFRRKKKYQPVMDNPLRAKELAREIKNIAFLKEVDSVGFADKETFKKFSINLEDYLPRAKTAICLGIKYPENIVKGESVYSGTVNFKLEIAEFAVAKYLEKLGYGALTEIAFEPGSYDEKAAFGPGGKTPFTPKTAAIASGIKKEKSTWDLFEVSSFVRDTRPFYGGRDNLSPDATANSYVAIAAGLGEMGLHGIALTPEYGARQRFLAIITDAPLQQDSLYQGPALCQKCEKCIQACPVSALHSEKRVLIEIEGKTFESASLNRLRCDWAKRYGLVGEAGPKYFGSKTDFSPPKKITPESLSEALKKRDSLQKERISIVERCLKACPSHLYSTKGKPKKIS